MRDFPTRSARAAALLILTALSGCDNVQWGGSSLQVVPPPPASDVVQVATVTDGPTSLGLPTGSVLFHVVRTETGAQIIPVAEISGDSLRTLRRPPGVSPQAYEQRFRRAVMEPNSQFVLFRRGAQVGTATVQANGPVSGCGVPSGLGLVTTVAAAAAEREFIAFRRGLEPNVVGEYSPPQVAGPIRRYGPLIAERLVLQNGLPRPRSWPGAQRDLQAVDVARGGQPEMASTFLVGDQLGVGAPEQEGWSVFFVASYEQRTGYNPFYTEVADYRKVGKRAPKLVDHLNWNRTGGADMLVQVFGERDSWYQAVSADRGGRWTRVWEGTACRGGG
ncbi:MAG TPA: hypothetical protein VF613_23335 [Longimicrobium sp.]|jgi:hypothetical protein